MKINKEWHRKHRVPKNATAGQRAKWHREHAKHCACRPMPESLKKLAGRRKGGNGLKQVSKPLRSYESVAATLQRHKEALQREYKIKELGIFGSYVRGKQKPRSDVDVLVDFDSVPDLLTFIQIEDRLGMILRCPVDLVDKQGIKPQLRESILSEVLYI